MSRGQGDRDLLFGLLAVRQGHVAQADLLDAFERWVADPRRTIAEILRDRGLIDDRKRRDLDAMVDGLGDDLVSAVDRWISDPERSITRVFGGLLPPSARGDGRHPPPLDRDETAAASDPEQTPLVPDTGATASIDGTLARPSPAELAAYERRELALEQRYLVVCPLARGGLGRIWVAVDLELDRAVALKEIRAGADDDPAARARARFLREAAITGRLEHPGIVPIYGVGRADDGRPFYAMRLVRGESLRDAIVGECGGQGRRRWADSRRGKELIRRFAFACDAVSYAHSRGVIHRDLKPGNIMLGAFGETLVVDWGLAKPWRDPARRITPDPHPRTGGRGGDDPEAPLTAAGSTLGTPGYISPEQAGGPPDAVGPRSDVYSLGATLYTILTGAPPPGGSRGAGDDGRPPVVLDPPRPVERTPDVPPPLEAICLKAMARSPADRYQTADALASDLRRWLDDEPVSAYREPWADRLARKARRNRGAVRASAAALLVITAVSLLAAVGIGRSLRESRRTAARLAFDRAVERCQAGEVHGGLFELTRALSLAEAAGDRPLQAACRANLSAWLPRSGRLRAGLDHPGPPGDVGSIAFRPDGRIVATASVDGTARLWDAATGALVASLEHGSPVRSVAFRPGGAMLLTACSDGSIWRRDAGDGTPIGPPLAMGDGRGTALAAFSPDGGTIAAVGTGGGRLFDAETGRPIVETLDHGPEAIALAFSPDGRLLATGGTDGSARIWDTSDGHLVREIAGHTKRVIALAFSADGRRLMTASWDGSARVWEVESGDPVGRPMEQADAILAACLSPDGRTVLTGGIDTTARLWDAATGEPRCGPLRHGGWVLAVAFHPTRPLAFTAGGDASVRIWDAAGGRPVASALPHGDVVVSLAVGPGGHALASGGTDDRARLWDLPDPDPAPVALAPPAGRGPRAFAAGGAICLVGVGAALERRDARTGRPLGPPIALAGEVTAVAASADGARFAVGDASGSIRVGDPASGTLDGRAFALGGRVTALAIATEGDGLLVAGDEHGTATVWETGRGPDAVEPVGRFEAHDDFVFSAEFGPGSALLTTSRDKTARLRHAETSSPIGPPLGHPGWVRDAALSPDGRLVATAGGEGEVLIRDARTGLVIGAPLSVPALPTAVAFAPDGQTLLVGCENGEAAVWHVATGLPVGPPLDGNRAVSALCYAPDGRSVLVATLGDQLIRRPLPPPLAGPPDAIRRMLAARTGQPLDADSSSGR